MGLDQFDKKLLTLVQIDSARPAEALGDMIGLSMSAVQRRLKRLRKDGYIEREVAVVAPQAVDRKLLVVIEVFLERDRSDLVSDFEKNVRSAPEIMHCLYVTGDADLILIANFRDMDEYELFATSFFGENVRRFRTSVVIRKLKSTLAVPVE